MQRYLAVHFVLGVLQLSAQLLQLLLRVGRVVAEVLHRHRHRRDDTLHFVGVKVGVHAGETRRLEPARQVADTGEEGPCVEVLRIYWPVYRHRFVGRTLPVA